MREGLRGAARLALGFIASCLFIYPCGAAEAGDRRLALTLDEAVRMALEMNLTIKDARLEVRGAEAGVVSEDGAFDPVFSAGLSETRSDDPAYSVLSIGEEDALGYEAAVSGKLRQGLEYEVSYSGGRNETGDSEYRLFDTYYSSGLVLALSQPLLRGRGWEVQESALRVSLSGLEAARLRAEHEAEETIAGVIESYWALYAAREGQRAAGVALQLAEGLHGEIRERVRVGLLAAADLLRAEATVAERKEDVLARTKESQDAEDTLREALGVGDWTLEIALADAPPEAASGEAPPSFEALLGQALLSRGDYLAAATEYKGKRISAEYYKNQRLPDLRLVGSAGVDGLAETEGEALEDTGSGKYLDWGLGLTLEITLGNRAARGAYAGAVVEAEQAETGVESVKRAVAFDVLRSIRRFAVAGEAVGAARATLDASRRTLEAEQERFGVGLASLNDVLAYQEEYARALYSLERARAEYASSAAGLARATGALLGPGDAQGDKEDGKTRRD